MAEPPGSDGRLRRPPPVPVPRRPAPPPGADGGAQAAPAASGASGSGVRDAARTEESSEAEATNPVALPDEASAVEEIIDLAANEAEALLIGGTPGEASDAQLADLNIRLAILSWDALADADASAGRMSARSASLTERWLTRSKWRRSVISSPQNSMRTGSVMPNP